MFVALRAEKSWTKHMMKMGPAVTDSALEGTLCKVGDQWFFVRRSRRAVELIIGAPAVQTLL